MPEIDLPEYDPDNPNTEYSTYANSDKDLHKVISNLKRELSANEYSKHTPNQHSTQRSYIHDSHVDISNLSRSQLEQKYHELEHKYHECLRQTPVNSIIETEVTKRDKYQSYHVSNCTVHTIRSKSYPILKEFIDCESPEDWPKSTNIFCWWDSHPFDTTPIPLPIKYDNKKKRFHVTGCFCSFSCMLAYNISLLRSVNKDLIIYFYNRAVPAPRRDIKEAPKRRSLIIYGGAYTIEEFRRKSRDPNISYEIIIPPLIVIGEILHETTKITPKEVDPTNNVKYRLKRTKPLPSANNTIRKSIKTRGTKVLSERSSLS